MDVHILSALSDNYMYVIVDKKSNDAAVVDPVESSKVIDFVKEKQLNLITVLTTHHHWDHAGGNKNIIKSLPQLKIYGGDERVEGITDIVKQGDRLKIGHLNVECLFTPCHTSGHICYKVTSDDGEINVFTGDTLFLGGCGKFFEGTPTQMYKALIENIGSLPNETKIYCGHEYTLGNLKYAKHVEPDNKEIDKRIELTNLARKQNQPTVPSTLGEERLYNPFMRVQEASVQKHSKQNDPIKTMEFLRNEKNNFKG